MRLRDGEPVEEISLEEARLIVAKHGLPLPELGEYKGERNAEGQRHGRGTCRFADGGVYEGEYKSGMQEGRGTYRDADGFMYDGEYKTGMQEGLGTYQNPDGAVGVCLWKAGDPVGVGVEWSADRQTAERFFNGDEKVEAISLEEARRVAAEHGLPLPDGV